MRRAVQFVGIWALTLLAGCVSGTGYAADLPQVRPLPMIHSVNGFSTPPEQAQPPDGYITLHPPDGPNIAREPTSHPITRLDAALLGLTLSPGISWQLYLLVLVF